jgi:hypothetical protein
MPAAPGPPWRPICVLRATSMGGQESGHDHATKKGVAVGSYVESDIRGVLAFYFVLPTFKLAFLIFTATHAAQSPETSQQTRFHKLKTKLSYQLKYMVQ